MGTLRPSYLLSLLDTDEFHRGNRCFRRADAHLLHEDFFYKFDGTSETARRISRDFPLDPRQQYFCRGRKISPLTWSFYKSKFCEDPYCIEFVRYRLHDKFNLGRDFYKVPYCVYRYCTDDRELTAFATDYFLYEVLRRLAVCVRSRPPTLQDRCMQRLEQLVKSRGREWLEDVAPKIRENFLSWEGGDGAPTPERDREALRSRFSALRGDALVDLFRERDAAFTREFVAWFRNDGAPDVAPYKRSHVLVSITFLHNVSDEKHVCLECMMRHHWTNKAEKGYFERMYRLCDDFLFHRLGTPEFWCRKCRRVALFQLLTLEDYKKEYGENVQRSFELFVT